MAKKMCEYCKEEFVAEVNDAPFCYFCILKIDQIVKLQMETIAEGMQQNGIFKIKKDTKNGKEERKE